MVRKNWYEVRMTEEKEQLVENEVLEEEGFKIMSLWALLLKSIWESEARRFADSAR